MASAEAGNLKVIMLKSYQLDHVPLLILADPDVTRVMTTAWKPRTGGREGITTTAVKAVEDERGQAVGTVP